jgi:hypothetical protein
MRFSLARLVLVGGLLLAATGCTGAEDGGGAAEQQPSSAPVESTGAPAEGTAGSPTGEEASAGQLEVLSLTETLAGSTATVDGTTLVFDVKGVSANESAATAHGVLTNSGAVDVALSPHFYDQYLIPDGVSISATSHQLNTLTITDPTTGNLHTPAYTTNSYCLCTSQRQVLAAGDSIAVTAQYAPLPAETQAVTLTFGVMGSFENVPVTRP